MTTRRVDPSEQNVCELAFELDFDEASTHAETCTTCRAALRVRARARAAWVAAAEHDEARSRSHAHRRRPPSSRFERWQSPVVFFGVVAGIAAVAFVLGNINRAPERSAIGEQAPVASAGSSSPALVASPNDVITSPPPSTAAVTESKTTAPTRPSEKTSAPSPRPARTEAQPRPSAVPAAPVLTPPTSTDPTAADLEEARAAARKGDASARARLDRLATSGDERVARRAAFTSAELDLVSGERERARATLEKLLACPDAALALDAAVLLASSLSTPADRVLVFKRHLAHNPPTPYRERALLEQSQALLDAGRTTEARAILDDVRRTQASLPPNTQRLFERLSTRAQIPR